VGLGKACLLCENEMESEGVRLAKLRDRLQSIIFNELDDVYLNGHPNNRLPHNLNFSIAGVEGESLLMAVSEVALSLGSACTTGSVAPSYVLRALGVPNDLAHASIRVGLGRFNTDEEMEYLGRRIVEAARRLRAISPIVNK